MIRPAADCLHSGDDVRICAAAADVSIHGLLDVVVRWPDRFGHHRHSRHDLTRGAVAALIAVVLDEGGLHGMQMIRLADALDGRDLIRRVHHGKRQARVHALAVHMHRAGAALAVIAALLGAGQVQVFAQAIEQRGPRIDAQRIALAVYLQGYGNRSGRRCRFRLLRKRPVWLSRPAAVEQWLQARPAPRLDRKKRRLTRGVSGWLFSSFCCCCSGGSVEGVGF